MTTNNNKIRPHCVKKFTQFDEFRKNMEQDIGEIKRQITNHIHSAIKEVSDKLNKRPSWAIMAIITFLTGLVMFLLGKIAL